MTRSVSFLDSMIIFQREERPAPLLGAGRLVLAGDAPTRRPGIARLVSTVRRP
jgi:hypothetical protein